MFNREKKAVVIQGKTEPVLKFEVWFQTPMGLFDAYEDAVKRLIADDMDINQCMKPVAVAISSSSYEVIG